MSTPQWFAEFERDEARRQDRLDQIRSYMAARDEQEAETIALIAELENIVQGWNQFDLIPSVQESRCREIGKRLQEIDGKACMTRAYRDARLVNPCASVLAAYWDGIGEWRW